MDQLEILLVEDDPDARANLIDILELDGHHVRACGSLGDVRDSGVQADVDIVILDRRLPDGNAEDALTVLADLLPNAEFIVVTGFANVESTIAAFKLGVTDYMLKPVHPDAIRMSVARIARHKRTENELRRERRFADQVLATSEAFIVMLDLEGRVLRFNQYFTTVTGWTSDDLARKRFIDHCVPESERTYLYQVLQETTAGNCLKNVCNGILTKAGRVRQVRWSDSTLTDENGSIIAVLAIGIDITDVVDAQNSAARDHRLAAIGQTVAAIAHESRNALHRINSCVEILKLDIPIESESREEVDSIARASSELCSALDEIRQFAAPIHLHREVVRLQDVWRRVWGHLAKIRDNRDAKLVETACDATGPVSVDVLRIEQVFRNLFENSLAACEDPVRIRIDCTCDEGDSILLDVEDNGPGLSAEQHERLFEPFFTTKQRGTGLGMSIVRRIIEAHHGEIQLANSVNGGVRYLIRLRKSEPVIGISSDQSQGMADV